MTRDLPVLPTSAAPRTSIFSLPLDLERCEAIVRLVNTYLAYIICNRRNTQVGRVGTCVWCVEATYTPGSSVAAARWNLKCRRLCVALRCGAEGRGEGWGCATAATLLLKQSGFTRYWHTHTLATGQQIALRRIHKQSVSSNWYACARDFYVRNKTKLSDYMIKFDFRILG